MDLPDDHPHDGVEETGGRAELLYPGLADTVRQLPQVPPQGGPLLPQDHPLSAGHLGRGGGRGGGVVSECGGCVVSPGVRCHVCGGCGRLADVPPCPAVSLRLVAAV